MLPMLTISAFIYLKDHCYLFTWTFRSLSLEWERLQLYYISYFSGCLLYAVAVRHNLRVLFIFSPFRDSFLRVFALFLCFIGILCGILAPFQNNTTWLRTNIPGSFSQIYINQRYFQKLRFKADQILKIIYLYLKVRTFLLSLRQYK